MLKKQAGLLLPGMLFFFSCGELPEIKPYDWNTRRSFTHKPYEGDLFTEWENTVTSSNITGSAGDVVQNVKKSQKWRGEGVFSDDAPMPVYYIFKAESGVVITIDWDKRDGGIDFAYKKVTGTGGVDWEPNQKRQIKVGGNEYLVLRISPPDEVPVPLDMTWEIGFTVSAQ
jgi:hypothetical protein